uniref:WW domain-binding protein 11-like n=1 Tax=Macaca mulatta TaxID=9544 RepID=UPI0010A27B66|nr:WW domain-binding protein 11-like [Macaca mulatta]
MGIPLTSTSSELRASVSLLLPLSKPRDVPRAPCPLFVSVFGVRGPRSRFFPVAGTTGKLPNHPVGITEPAGSPSWASLVAPSNRRPGPPAPPPRGERSPLKRLPPLSPRPRDSFHPENLVMSPIVILI